MKLLKFFTVKILKRKCSFQIGKVTGSVIEVTFKCDVIIPLNASGSSSDKLVNGILGNVFYK